MILIPHLFDFATTEEFLEGLRIRREFVIRNNPVNLLKRQVEIDEAKIECEFCGDTGFVSVDERNESGEWMRNVGIKKCICQYNEDLEDINY